MKNLLLTTTLAFALSAPAYGGGTHSAGHDDGPADENAAMTIGMPGDAASVGRTIDVTMRETDDGDMVFEPVSLEIAKGETIRFNVMNKGELEHEFVIDTVEGNTKHKGMMAEMDMEHDDPNSIRLDEGGSGEVIWKFENDGIFEFACLIPGHYESGMHGPITVGEDMAQAELKYSAGTIKKIDAKKGKVTIKHGHLVNLDMPGMTMIFRADKDMISEMSVGQDIEFVEDRIKGKVTIVKMK